MIFFLLHNHTSDTNPENWVDLYADLLYRFAILRLNDENLAQDMVQETFLSALKSIKKFEQKSSIQTWLITILKNKIIDHYRKSFTDDKNTNPSIAPNDDFGDYLESGMWNSEKAPKNWNKSAEDIFEETEFFEILHQCLALLPEQSRRVFSLREIDGMKSKEICKELDISASNLWVLLHRARNGLRKCIEKIWIAPQHKIN